MARTSSRALSLFVLCCLAGCQSAEKASLQPIDPGQPPPTFAELMQRGKGQINAAHEFYYSDRWKDLEQAAVALKETSSYVAKLPQANWTEPQKAKLVKLTQEFGEAADTLKAAGAAQDATKTSQAFQRLHDAYRQLRAEQLVVAP
jgi:hypothetical protein